MDTNLGLPFNLFQQIRNTLLTFDVFDDERPLRHRFIDERLAPWRHQLPQADSRQQQVTAVMSLLYSKTNQAGENGLVCLLAVLQQEVGAADGRHAQLAVLAQALQVHLQAGPNHIEPAPFKGLRYFEEGDAHLFFGREALTADLIAHLCQHRFLAVVGASGSGKSSVVRAGVIPAVRRGEVMYQGQRSDGWPIYVMTPGDAPLKALAAILTREVESVTAMGVLLADMTQNSQSLDWWLYRQLTERANGRLLLVVDQFEELFTQCDDAPMRQLFMDNLVQAVSSGQQGRLSLVLTLRADFYTQALQYQALVPLLETREKIVTAMTAVELAQAIEEPIKDSPWHFQDGLVDTILQDVGVSRAGNGQPEPGALPLLSHALLETWQRREGRVMTLAGYRASGGVGGAIAETADRVYEQLPPERNTFYLLQITSGGD